MPASITTTFTPFLSFPPELHRLILSSCPANDQTCLRLTCKYLYNLTSTPWKELMLGYSDPGYLCQSSAEPPAERGTFYSRNAHRRLCHDICYEEAVRRAEHDGLPVPKVRRVCSTRRWSEHCECFEGKNKLYQRLSDWMPRGMRYCSQCRRYTKRKLRHRGRCYHGQPKPRKSPRNFWTYRSHRGGFGRRMWKKWFNNQSMNRLENRLGDQMRSHAFRWAPGYNLRPLSPKVVNTKNMRYG